MNGKGVNARMEADLPTSLERLVRHRAAHADSDASRRVWLFHAHVYFDHQAPQRIVEARAFMQTIRETFADNRHLEVHSLVPGPAGPHPRGSFEVLFTREVFADCLAWLMFMRPEALDILIHPLTRSLTLDHTARALWLGTPNALDRAMLESADARLQASGRTEESIIEGSKRH